LLKTEGLVDIQPQRGTFVFRIGASEARELSEFREVLEISALRLAMAKDAVGLGQTLAAVATDMSAALGDNDAATYLEQDGRFHQCIIDRCDNHYLSRSYAVIASFRRCATGWRWTPPSTQGPSSSTACLRG